MSSSTRSRAFPARAVRRAIARTSPRITGRCRRTASSATGTSRRWSRSWARSITFVPHLVPLDRGILETIYVKVAPGTTPEQIARRVRRRRTIDEPFVRLTGDALPEIKHVAWTNFCDIGWRLDPGTRRLVIVVVPRQPREGRGGPGAAELQRRVRLRRTDGAAVTGPLVLKLGGELLETAGTARAHRGAARPRSPPSGRSSSCTAAGAAIDAELDRRGIAPKKVDGLRVTDAATLDVGRRGARRIGQHRAGGRAGGQRRRGRRPDGRGRRLRPRDSRGAAIDRRRAPWSISVSSATRRTSIRRSSSCCSCTGTCRSSPASASTRSRPRAASAC